MRNIKIGVEIEFYGVHYKTVLDSLHEAGIEVSYEGYTHRVMSGWKLVTDCSVNRTNTGLSKGLELVSPILKGDDGLDELQVVMNTLNNIGAKVDRTCGLHVHHDIQDYDVEHLISLFNLYFNYEPAINKMMPKSRRNQQYCKELDISMLKRIQKANTIVTLADTVGTRYYKLNVQSYIKYGTIEFRQHSGTVEFEKIEAWIISTHTMLNYCKHHKVALDRTVQHEDLEELLAMLNLDGSYAGNFILERAEALAC